MKTYKNYFFFNPASFDIYHKNPRISPGAYNFQRPFLIEGLIYGGKLHLKIG